jgi:hypothetical protein
MGIAAAVNPRDFAASKVYNSACGIAVFGRGLFPTLLQQQESSH